MRFALEKLEGYPDLIAQFADDKEIADIVHVYDVSSGESKIYNDISDEHLIITL